MRQPTDLSKIKYILDLHVRLIKALKSGTLKGKIKTRLKARADKVGMALRTYYRNRHKLKPPANG